MTAAVVVASTSDIAASMIVPFFNDNQAQAWPYKFDSTFMKLLNQRYAKYKIAKIRMKS